MFFTQQIYNLVEAILYVRKNEITARIVFLHAYETAADIPSELEANVKLLDEAFPVCSLGPIILSYRVDSLHAAAVYHP